MVLCGRGFRFLECCACAKPGCVDSRLRGNDEVGRRCNELAGRVMVCRVPTRGDWIWVGWPVGTYEAGCCRALGGGQAPALHSPLPTPLDSRPVCGYGACFDPLHTPWIPASAGNTYGLAQAT